MDYYRKEVLDLIQPFKLNGYYLGWQLTEIIFDSAGTYFLKRVILRFIKPTNEFRLYLKKKNNKLILEHQYLIDESNVTKLKISFSKLLAKKQTQINASLFFSAFGPEDNNFLNKLKKFPQADLVSFLKFKGTKIGNNKQGMQPVRGNQLKVKKYDQFTECLQLADLFYQAIKQNNELKIEKIYEVILQIKNEVADNMDYLEKRLIELFKFKKKPIDKKLLAFIKKEYSPYKKKFADEFLAYAFVKDFLGVNKEQYQILKNSQLKELNDYDAVVAVDYYLDCLGLGDFLRKDKFFIRKIRTNQKIIVSDMSSLYFNNPNYDFICNDLVYAFEKGNLLNKRVLILDFNLKRIFFAKNLERIYFLFLYQQYFRLFRKLGFRLDFKLYLFKPNEGVKYIIERINKDKRIKIVSPAEIVGSKNKIYSTSRDILSSVQSRINKKKKIIGLSANYSLDYPSDSKKGWSLENWQTLIELLNKKFTNLQFVLLPVYNHLIFDLNPEQGGMNYHYKMYQQYKDNFDLILLDDLVKDYIMKNKLYGNDFLLKSNQLEFLKAAISFCDLVIALDSGPAHVSAILDVPVISLFSQKGNVFMFKPFGEKSYALFKTYKNQEVFKDYLNINEIQPQQVVDFVSAKKLI